MFIRQTTTRTRKDGTVYSGHRLVHNVRIGDKVHQKTLLHLGRDFPIEKSAWPQLCQRIKERLSGQTTFVKPLPKVLEDEAERIVRELLARKAERLQQAQLAEGAPVDPAWRTVDVRSVRMTNARSVGCEYVGLWALGQLGVPKLLMELGFTAGLCRAALGLIVGRLAKPDSEHATYEWLCMRSGLEEFLQARFKRLSRMQLYRASDRLVAHRKAIEAHVFGEAMALFGLESTVTLFDLTNSYLEGEAKAQAQAKRGRSKEKRSDCPLVTLALVVDGSGFVRRSQIFAGNVREDQTLHQMLAALGTPKAATVVMDRGVATAANVQWLIESGYTYLVVSRERARTFDPEAAGRTLTELDNGLELYDVREEAEVRVYCRSPQRRKKEEAIVQRRRSRFEAQLTQLNDGLSKPRTRKRLNLVQERIGRLKANSGGIAQHYEITVEPDENEQQATAVTWTLKPKAHTMWTHPGVYSLRTNLMDLPVERLWQTYIMLTDLEAVFRSLKSELGLRPIYHQKDHRTEGHLFITVLAYQAVQVIRTRLRQKGLTWSWKTLRDRLASQTRATFSQKQLDGRTVHTRVTSEPDQYQREVYEALGLDPVPLNPQITTI